MTQFKKPGPPGEYYKRLRLPREPRLRGSDPYDFNKLIPASLYLKDNEKAPISEEFIKMTDCLLNVKEVSKLINVKVSTIYYWIHKGTIPHVKFPGAVRFQASEIMEWIKKKQRGGQSRQAPSEMANQFFKNKR